MIKPFDIVRATRNIDDEGTIIPANTIGTVVHKYNMDNGFDVEFTLSEESIVVTVYSNEIEKYDDNSVE